MNQEAHCATIAPLEVGRYVVAEPPRILIVEDDPDMARMIATILEQNWIDCQIRHSGAQGISAFASESFDLIITDLKMAAGSGISLIESVRRSSQTPIIIVTGFSREYADQVRFLDHVTVVEKPFEPRVLIKLVEKALDISQAQRGCMGIEVIDDTDGFEQEVDYTE